MNPDEFFKIFIKIFSLVSVWHPYQRSKTVQVLYKIHYMIFVINTAMYTFFIIVNLYFFTDFSDLIYRLYTAMKKAAFTVKVLNNFFNNKSIQIIQKMPNEFVVFSSDEDESIEKNRKAN